MKIKSVSSNMPGFRAVQFNDRFNAIVGDSQKKGDARAHNLGKTTIIRIIQFVLFNGSKDFADQLVSRNNELEFSVLIDDGGVQQTYSRDFKRRKRGEAKTIETEVDYEYFIRFQNEFDLDSPFKKEKFRGKDITWKPKLIGLLGFDEKLLYNKLSINAKVTELGNAIGYIRKTGLKVQQNRVKIEELEVERKLIREHLSTLNLLTIDDANSKDIVERIDNEMSGLEIELYVLKKELNKIELSIKSLDSRLFNYEKIEAVFNDAHVYFSESLKRNLNDLKVFYDAVNKNRKQTLGRLKLENGHKIAEIHLKLESLEAERNLKLKSLVVPESQEKYKSAMDQLLEIEKQIFLLKRDVFEENVEEMEKELDKLKTEAIKVSARLAENIDNNKRMFDEICGIYTNIMKASVNIDAKIEIIKRSTGNIDLEPKSYRGVTETKELKGATAKRISAAAVDIAIRAVQNADHGFIIQDGVIDEVDSNTATQFVACIKDLVKRYDFQYVLTAIKDKLPGNISESDIVIELNDYNNSGLLCGIRY